MDPVDSASAWLENLNLFDSAMHDQSAATSDAPIVTINSLDENLLGRILSYIPEHFKRCRAVSKNWQAVADAQKTSLNIKYKYGEEGLAKCFLAVLRWRQFPGINTLKYEFPMVWTDNPDDNLHIDGLAMALLAPQWDIQSLAIRSGLLSPTGIEALATAAKFNWKNLRVLTLEAQYNSICQLGSGEYPSLEEFTLGKATLLSLTESHGMYRFLTKCPNLKKIDLSFSKVCDTTIDQMLNAPLPLLETFISSFPFVCPRFMEALRLKGAHAWPSLKSLCLENFVVDGEDDTNENRFQMMEALCSIDWPLLEKLTCSRQPLFHGELERPWSAEEMMLLADAMHTKWKLKAIEVGLVDPNAAIAFLSRGPYHQLESIGYHFFRDINPQFMQKLVEANSSGRLTALNLLNLYFSKRKNTAVAMGEMLRNTVWPQLETIRLQTRHYCAKYGLIPPLASALAGAAERGNLPKLKKFHLGAKMTAEDLEIMFKSPWATLEVLDLELEVIDDEHVAAFAAAAPQNLPKLKKLSIENVAKVTKEASKVLFRAPWSETLEEIICKANLRKVKKSDEKCRDWLEWSYHRYTREELLEAGR